MSNDPNLKDKLAEDARDLLALPGELHVDPLEKKWLFVSLGLIGIFVLAILYTAFAKHVHPPGGMETIDSARLHLGGEFAEDKLGVTTQADGSVKVTLVAARYGFYPREIKIPAGQPITFRIASADVLHGIHIPMTNMGTMVVPGYASTVTTTFPKPGEYPMLCNEYCGMGHDHMWSKVEVVSQETWRAGATNTQSTRR
jgi:cytochrome c oxidase subunit 2